MLACPESLGLEMTERKSDDVRIRTRLELLGSCSISARLFIRPGCLETWLDTALGVDGGVLNASQTELSSSRREPGIIIAVGTDVWSTGHWATPWLADWRLRSPVMRPFLRCSIVCAWPLYDDKSELMLATESTQAGKALLTEYTVDMLSCPTLASWVSYALSLTRGIWPRRTGSGKSLCPNV